MLVSPSVDVEDLPDKSPVVPKALPRSDKLTRLICIELHSFHQHCKRNPSRQH